MRRVILLGLAALAIGCEPAEQQPAQEQPAQAQPEAAATGSLANLAGAWVITAMAESIDSVLITYELNATATSDGWTSTLPGREPMPLRVIVADSDSVVAEAGPFDSALRPGARVTTRTTIRPQGDTLTGTIVARYRTDGADSVVTSRLHGTRKGR